MIGAGVLVETSLGAIVVDLFTGDAPMACRNFVGLCKGDHYHGCSFYNLHPTTFVECGAAPAPKRLRGHDSASKGTVSKSLWGHISGDGSPGYFEDELKNQSTVSRSGLPRVRLNKKGLLIMANDGTPNTNSSRFLITLTDRHLDYLEQKHTVFGRIGEGADAFIQKLSVLPVDKQRCPLRRVRIRRTTVLHESIPWTPSEKSYLEQRTRALLAPTNAESSSESEGEGADAKKTDDARRDRVARTRVLMLKLLKDYPDTDVQPPDNVLFVCKLNPVTSDADLAIIFSQFGKILSCEILRDWRTGDSLQYAFVEFEDVAGCQRAYTKMDNVLIDDRRIHVDFSQSVSGAWAKHAASKRASQP